MLNYRYAMLSTVQQRDIGPLLSQITWRKPLENQMYGERQALRAHHLVIGA